MKDVNSSIAISHLQMVKELASQVDLYPTNLVQLLGGEEAG